MAQKSGDYDRLVGMIYEAALESGHWDVPFNELIRQIGGSGFHFLGWSSELKEVPFAACSESWQGYIDGYHSEYGKIDPHLQAGLKDPVGCWLVSHERFDERFVSRNQCYQEYLIPSGVRHLMGTSLVRDEHLDVVAAVGKPPGTKAFSADEIALVKRITPHLQRAVALHMRTDKLRDRAAFGALGLQTMESGILALDKTGRVLFANPFAEDMLRRGNFLKVQAGRLLAGLRDDAKQLSGAIARALASRAPQVLGLRKAGGGETDRCIITVVRLSEANRLFTIFSRPELLVLIRLPNERRGPAARDLVDLFEFTGAEARLAEGMACGLSLQDYAAQTGVAKDTVRAQLKAIFIKTGAQRQSELVRLLCDVPAPYSAKNVTA